MSRYHHPTYRHARRYWASLVDAGGVVCHLCGRVIVGAFDLDHVRGQAGDLHPAHPGCNRAEGGRWCQAWRGPARLERGARRLDGGPVL